MAKARMAKQTPNIRTLNVERRSQRRSALGVERWALDVCFDLVPNRIHLGQLHFAQFPAARFEFVL